VKDHRTLTVDELLRLPEAGLVDILNDRVISFAGGTFARWLGWWLGR
jgi:hypothetical protein